MLIIDKVKCKKKTTEGLDNEKFYEKYMNLTIVDSC